MSVLENKYFIKPRGETWTDNPTYYYDNSCIVLNSPRGVFSSDVIGNEMAIDTFSFTCRYSADAYKAYLTSDTQKAYVCSDGYVEGDFENSGWIRQRMGHVQVSGNDVTCPAPYNDSGIRTKYLHAGDVVTLRVAVDVTNVTNETEQKASIWFANPPTVGTISSKTGLFTVSEGTYLSAYTDESGEDVLTFVVGQDVASSTQVWINITGYAGAKFTISSITFNGETIYGYPGEGEPTTPKLYLLKPKYTAGEYLTDLNYGDPVYWAIGDSIFAKGYVSQVERTGKYAWKVTCVSGVGLLTDKMHAGGIYQSGATVASVVAEIIGDTFDYSISEEAGNTPVFGWLPYDSARANLHRVLFAVGALLRKHDISFDDNDIDYEITYPSNATTSVEDSRIALGNKVKMSVPADAVEVTEHSFSALQSDPVETIYDNTTGDTNEADHLTVVFDEPMHGLAVTGTLVINEQGVNYAIITGTGVLTGKPYTHSKTVVSFGDTAGNRIKRVADNGIVTIANSYNVARRVLNYYQSAKKVTAKLLASGEKCGDMLTMSDAWGEPIRAFLSKMDVTVTTVKGATCELVDGYTPTAYGNNFTRYKIINRSSASKTFTAAKAGMARIVIMQGGTGGQGGCAGHDGWGGYPPSFGDSEDGQMKYVHDVSDFDATPPYYCDPAHHDVSEIMSYIYGSGRQYAVAGGAAGEPGEAGKVLVITRQLAQGETLTFTIGQGGAGGSAREHGAEDGGLGTAGTHTTVSSSAGWSATSEDGTVSENGYFELFTNRTFGLPGEDGHDGGNGGTSDAQNTDRANIGAAGNMGEAVGNYSGGAGGKGIAIDAGWGFIAGANNTASGGGGGGAAWGNVGNAGKAAHSIKRKNDDQTWTYTVTSGTGGDGANAKAPAKPTYGQGGGGGNGGGGGGNNGGGVVRHYYDDHKGAQLLIGIRHGTSLGKVFNGGDGGAGSVGGAGGDGVAIIYYDS